MKNENDTDDDFHASFKDKLAIFESKYISGKDSHTVKSIGTFQHLVLDRQRYRTKSSIRKGVTVRGNKLMSTDQDELNKHGLISNPDYQCLKIFHGPVQLISETEEGVLKAVDNTVHEISQIHDPIVTVAVTGLYRQGKSYLLNRITTETSGFPVGHTFQPKTKGIWAMCKEHPKQKNTVLMLLDTEGQADVSRGDMAHDHRIATLTILLCDILCFNMLGVINQDAIDKISYIAELAKRILNNSQSQLTKHLPIFLLCLRDFYLETRKDDKILTADEYLEECLSLRSGSIDQTEKYNKSRRCIKDSFSNRKCFTFDFPTEGKQMVRLDTLQDEELSPYFLADVEKFVSYIFEIKPRVFRRDRKINGSVFATFLKCHLDAICAEMIPDMRDTLLESFDQENETLVQTTVKEYQDRLKMIKLPVLCAGVMDSLICDGFLEMELKQFRGKAKLDDDRRFEQKARKQMHESREELRRINAALIYEHCIKSISQIYEEKIGYRKKYFKSEGHLSYKSDIASVTWTYMDKCKDLDETERNRAFVTFMELKSNEEQEIIAEDTRITEEKRRQMQKMIQDEHQKQKDLLQRRCKEFSKMNESLEMERKSEQDKMFEIRVRCLQTNLDVIKSGSLVCPKCGKWLCASWKKYKTPCR